MSLDWFNCRSYFKKFKINWSDDDENKRKQIKAAKLAAHPDKVRGREPACREDHTSRECKDKEEKASAEFKQLLNCIEKKEAGLLNGEILIIYHSIIFVTLYFLISPLIKSTISEVAQQSMKKTKSKSNSKGKNKNKA